MYFFRNTCLITICLLSGSLSAQHFLGISANGGNRLVVNPEVSTLKTPPAIFGSLFYEVREQTESNWIAEYGLDFGVMGYVLNAIPNDTISSGGFGPNVFYNLQSIYTNVHLQIGKGFQLNQKQISPGIGGGITYYIISGNGGYAVGIVGEDGKDYDLFDAHINETGMQWVPYLKIKTDFEVNKVIQIGLAYEHRWKASAKGYYFFFHTKNEVAPTGELLLYHRELRLLVKFNVFNPNSSKPINSL